MRLEYLGQDMDFATISKSLRSTRRSTNLSAKQFEAKRTSESSIDEPGGRRCRRARGRGGRGGVTGPGGGVRGNTLVDPTNRMSASSEFVPLSAIYGPGGTAAADPPGPTMDRSPPLTNAGPPLPPPVIDTRARAVADDGRTFPGPRPRGRAGRKENGAGRDVSVRGRSKAISKRVWRYASQKMRNLGTKSSRTQKMKSDDNSMSMCSVFARDRLRRTRAATKRVPLALRAKWIALASVFGLSFWNAIISVSLSSPGHSDNFDHPPCVTSANAATDKHLHIALVWGCRGLATREPGVFDEFEAALNEERPLERAVRAEFIRLHFRGQQCVRRTRRVLIRTQVTSWETRNQVEMHVYDVQHHIKSLEAQMLETFRPSFPNFTVSYGTAWHTIGTWLRLYAHRFIEHDAENLLYIDIDCVIMANLDGIADFIEQQVPLSIGEISGAKTWMEKFDFITQQIRRDAFM
ncbi:hypothetical protein THAOC_01114 [Thalassiosira oceanica]|uniref:Uncharacterized protein n=1 Tax=Thalassiosira oceanica TaxID=159749 RepID=K0TEE6_THAOC|nr:hypothetical protein THAOC_01114 [Thalassiosira oceanica]|eukprot:EJK77078.1 hypothetical protein THAOC_01114 [Thalassiosira oceanica]